MKELIEAKAIEDVFIKTLASTLLAGYLDHEEAKSIGTHCCAGLATIMELSTEELEAYKEKAMMQLNEAMRLMKETQEAVKH